ncbi:polysaccharide pyruvyl transferase family protein [Aerococcus urinaeequi]|uniref:polysaccharide pyruvyl transferase family protein n=1 Tax=Aerococcus urinaeequi TaxID=51665 RepID=UPI003ED86A98
MKYVSLHGAYYPNNFGDVLILAIQAKWIREITGKEIILPFATDIYRKQLNTSEIRGAKGIKQSDFLVYGAGGFLGEPPMGKSKWYFNFLRNHLKPAIIARKNNIPYAINGTEVGPINNKIVRYSIKKLLSKSSNVTLRNSESVTYAQNNLQINKNITESADVALSLTKNDLNSEIIENIYQTYLNFDGPKFAVHVGANRKDLETGQNVQIFLDEVIEFYNSKKDLKPIIIIDNENEIQKDATDYLKSKLKIEPIVYVHKDIWETVSLLSQLDAVVTNKLHIGIVSYAMGNIPISFPYHTKTERFYKQIGLEHLCKPISSIKPGMVKAQLEPVLIDIQNGNKDKYLKERDYLRERALINKQNLEKVFSKRELHNYE